MDPIAAAFEPLLGTPSWGVTRGHGSFVTMEFGEPELTVHDPRRSVLRFDDGRQRPVTTRLTTVHGAWHLWIYCCLWRLEHEGTEIAHCESDHDTMGRALQFLSGQALMSVEVRADASTSFVFDLGCCLTTRPAPDGTYAEEPVDQWMLYQPDGEVLAVRSDGAPSFETHTSV